MLALRVGQSLALADDVALRLRRGDPVSDEELDALYPDTVRDLSRLHWSPLPVIRKAVELLVPTPGRLILDVGSGPGKFCLVGAMMTRCCFLGVEQRAWLTRVAITTRDSLGLAGVWFETGNALDRDWSGFDGVYLFNPFGENVNRDNPIDQQMPFGKKRYRACVRKAAARMAQLRPGALVALYHGYGRRMPPGFERLSRDYVGTGYLDLWVRR